MRVDLPVFFVDSPEWNQEHSATREELRKLHEFVRSLDSLPTRAVVTPSIRYLKIE
jgi:hypothetical protein